MVKLIAIYKDDENYQFLNRQFPIHIDKNLSLVVHVDDQIRACRRNNKPQIDLKTFSKNYNSLTEDEIRQACTVSEKELFVFLSQHFPCVGCRRSAEEMFQQLSEQAYPALEPLYVTPSGMMGVKKNVLSSTTVLHRLLYQDKSYLYNLVENIAKNKKNKRCYLHTLEMQKPKLSSRTSKVASACTGVASTSTPQSGLYFGNGSWMDIWNDLSRECKEEIIILDCEGVMTTMEEYLKRHRFCGDCKMKVARAFNILIGEVDAEQESSYCPGLFVGLRYCSQGGINQPGLAELTEYRLTHGDDKDSKPIKRVPSVTTTSGHIHLCCETAYIAHLLTRAEAEISGGRRERHAKTIDVAQEEVLTCIGLHLYERLHKVWQKVRAEHQTWRVLFYVGVETLRKNFEICIEEKVGMGKLEALCEELEAEEKTKELKQEKKRMKKKRQKKRKEEQKKLAEEVEDEEPTRSPCNSNSRIKNVKLHLQENGSIPLSSDLGYSSGLCESSMSSREGSEVACSEGFCNHEGDHECNGQTKFHLKVQCNKTIKVGRSCHSNGMKKVEVPVNLPLNMNNEKCDGCHNSQLSRESGKKKGKRNRKKNNPTPNIIIGEQPVDGAVEQQPVNNGGSKLGFQSQLLGMLEEEDPLFGSFHNDKNVDPSKVVAVNSDHEASSDEGDAGLTAEEVAEFERNRSKIESERLELREKIKRNFDRFVGSKDENGDEELVKATTDIKVANGFIPYPVRK